MAHNSILDSTGFSSVRDLFDGRSTLSRVATGLIGPVALLMVVVHFTQLFTYVLPSGLFINMHIGFALVLCALIYLEGIKPEQTLQRAMGWISLAIVVGVAGYIHLNYNSLIYERSFAPNTYDLIAASLLLIVAMLLSGLHWGWTIPGLAIIGLAYGHWGYLFPGDIFFHGGISGSRLISYTSIPYFQGLLGGLASLSAGTIFAFMVFGGALRATGAIDYFVKVGFAAGNGTRSGPALVAVISSSMMGTVSGSSVSNVASTGAMTIPLMKRYGFSGSFAGSVESVASTGGQLVPPVMGLAAFLIVGMTGMEYSQIMVAAIAPAIIFYAYLLVAVHVRAVKMDLDINNLEVPDDGMTLGRATLLQWHLIASIALLIALLTSGYPAGLSAVVATISLLGFDALMTFARGGFGFGAFKRAIARVINGLVIGARSGATVALVIAVMGILIEVLTVTGFAQKLSFFLLDLADGQLLNLAIIVAISCLIFGLGLPTSAAYFIVALFGAPALVNLGVPLLAAHFFCFYFANLSSITPPVAIAALVAAKIAKAKFWPTALQAVRLGLPGFLVPFVFLFQPELLGIDGGIGAQIIVVIKALIAVCALVFVFEGYVLQKISIVERVILLPAALGCVYPDHTISLASAVVIVAIVTFGVIRGRGAAGALQRPATKKLLTS